MLQLKAFFKQCSKVKRTINHCSKRFVSKRNFPKNSYSGTSCARSPESISLGSLNEKGMNIRHMNASVLCIFSNMLLRENIKNDFLWRCIEKRSYELLDRFEINEVASFLFCLSKNRMETQLFESFISIIKKKREYLNTSNLAMLISAYSKRKDKDLIILLKEEFKKKIYTVHNIVEISMILNALVKCKIYDEELLNKLSSIIIDLIYNTHNIHVRDICVIVFCYSYIAYKNKNIFKILAQKIALLINEVKLVDLCRIFFSYMNIRMNNHHILRISALRLKNVLNKSTIDEVINCIHFLPNLKKTIEKKEEIPFSTKWELLEEKELGYSINYFYLFNYVVNMFNEKLISFANILDSNQISNIFYIYSRHNILMSPLKLEMFIRKIKKMNLAVELKIYILYSLTIHLKNLEENVLYNFDMSDINKIFLETDENILKNIKKNNETIGSCVNEEILINIKNELLSCLKNWEYDIHLFVNNCEICSVQDIIKISYFLYTLKYMSNPLIQGIKHYIIFKYRSINESTASMLLFYFQKFFKMIEDDDFIEILKLKCIREK